MHGFGAQSIGFSARNRNFWLRKDGAFESFRRFLLLIFCKVRVDIKRDAAAPVAEPRLCRLHVAVRRLVNQRAATVPLARLHAADPD